METSSIFMSVRFVSSTLLTSRICQALVPNLPIMLGGGLHGGLGLSIGSLLGVVRRVWRWWRRGMVVRRRRMRGVKGRREGRSTPGPGLVVVGWGTSERRPGGMEGRGEVTTRTLIWSELSNLQLQTRKSTKTQQPANERISLFHSEAVQDPFRIH